MVIIMTEEKKKITMFRNGEMGVTVFVNEGQKGKYLTVCVPLFDKKINCFKVEPKVPEEKENF